MARPCLNNNVKFKKLVRVLGLPRPYVRGLLETLWDVANESGNPILGTPDDVETAAEWPAEPGKLFAAMSDCGFIDQNDGGRWQVHDYWDHCPDYVRKRREREMEREARGQSLSDVRREASKARWSKRSDASGMQTDANGMQADASGRRLHESRRPADANGMQMDASGMQTDANVRTPTPAPAPKEKDSSEPSELGSKPPPSALFEDGKLEATEAPVLDFPTVGRGPKSWKLYPSKLREWAESFPAANVEAECRKAWQWVQDNPTKRKTAQGMPAFLSRWLSKVQDSGRAMPVAQPVAVTVEDQARRAREQRERIARLGGDE